MIIIIITIDVISTIMICYRGLHFLPVAANPAPDWWTVLCHSATPQQGHASGRHHPSL